jgi:mono/diheme cytochrome c family protein
MLKANPNLKNTHAITAFLGAVVAVCAVPGAHGQDAFDFAHKVLPVLKKHCAECHTGGQKKGGLSLNTRESMLAGGESGAEMLTKDNTSSELLARITATDSDLRMPPEGPGLSPAEIDAVREWVQAGLPWESGFSFGTQSYEPPLFPRRPELPAARSPDRNHPIDRILDADRNTRRLEPLPTIDDAQFLRRAYLDLIGLLPTPEQTKVFLADRTEDKRERLIRSLLDKDLEYAEHWLTFWNDLLRNDYSGTGFITNGRTQISKWLYDALIQNKTYDAMARELIAPPSGESSGFANGIRWRGEVSAGQTVEIQFAQSVGQSFLGINLKCASCHDSFIDRWTLNDAYGLAAIYSNSPLKIHRCDKPTGQMAKAAWLFEELGTIDGNAPQPERLKQLASLMTHPQNGRFSRTIVNRIWHRLMGYGIVHPTDAMQTQPWNEDLLDHLAVDFVDKGYDLRELLFTIASSKAYQSPTERMHEKNSAEAYSYQGPRARRMTAEQFVDSVWQLTGAAPPKFDAPVVRGKPVAFDGDKPRASDPTGSWIWSETAQAPSVPPAGERITFRQTLDLSKLPEKAFGVITCDNEYKLWINDRLIVEDKNWESLESFDAKPALRTGLNTILVEAFNGGSGPNPAALYFEMNLIDPQVDPQVDPQKEQANVRSIASSENWQYTASVPDAQGKLAEGIIDWKKAVVAKGPWGSRLQNEIAMGLSGSGLQGPMVRASLVKADPLMRSLGRPNRDQIVSTRPTELTTLEAMDLSNGQTLADWLERGAAVWHSQLSDSGGAYRSPKELLDAIYLHALCRNPRPQELQTIEEMIGPTLEPSELADILWSILMLPEFQYVR